MNKIYAIGNYFFVQLDGDTTPNSDAKGNVVVNLYELSPRSYVINSPKLGELILPLSTLVDQVGTAYTQATWEEFYLANSGFNPASGGSGAGASILREEFTWTSGAQTFTLASSISQVYSVEVQGQGALSSSQYTIGANSITITDTLDANDYIVVIYSANTGGVNTFYTQAQTDSLFINQSNSFVFVYSKSDLPTPVSGVITLGDNVTYYITATIDLTGDRLVCGQNTTIIGGSSENCILKSTGLNASTALITSVYSLPIRNITITHGTALNLDGDATTTALDWFGVNFTDCANVGLIKDYTNFVMSDSAFLNSGNLTFDGTIGTIGMSNCLFDCASGSTALILPSTLTVSRRFRVIYSSFVVLSGETGINVNTSAVISSERYILDTVNFSGGGTYQSGVVYTDNKALFVNCVGITNTSTKGFMYMLNNGTDTAIGVANVNVWVKATGTTTSGTNSKFTHTTNRLTYNGAFTNSFLVTLNATVRSGGSNQSISIGVAKNGVIISESEGIIRTATSNVEHGGSTQAVLEMAANDYIELFVRNTGSIDIRVTDFNFNVVKIPV